ncbi:macrophage immunometabolism regulator-like [Anguilla rostrata]|uniref:macrophage immunometabolism regulator-like n=1 Tax=Anguilla rostrata TaxID=7938 RepID=UPI0030D4F08C
MEVAGASRAPVSVLPAAATTATATTAAAELNVALKPEGERPRCSSTPCSPIRGPVSGYQILHMDSSYLVGFATGEELLKAAHKRPGGEPTAAEASPAPTPRAKPLDPALHRAARLYKTKSRYYQPYEIPAAGGRRRRRMPSSGERCLRAPGAEPGRALHGPLPLCLLRGRRPHSKSLDYLNLDKMSVREPADTDVLQRQLQHLTLRAERAFARDKT